jgi:Tol biopolymer transport system component/DNA-binding winged helix-turn-helix (wHTH) protein
MSLDQPTQTVISFGPFEANLQTQELKRQGVRLRLPRQSFQILAMLLQRPGQLIPREELQQALWPSDTFVDFEKGINAAINRLREALGDSAETPRYIETLPRRGYRFIAPVENRGAEVGQSGRSIALSGNAGWMVHFASTKRLALLFSFVGLFALAPIILRLNLRSPQPRVIDWVQITKDGLLKGGGRLLSDGTRLYFEELLPEGDALMQVSTQGGETARIPLALEWLALDDISPTRSELLISGGSTFQVSNTEIPLWIMPLPAGPPHRVGDILAHDACWAPDGLHLAYLNDKDLFVAKPDGSEVRKLTTTDGFTTSIRFSPDGTRLRFAVSHSTDTSVEDMDIMEIGADGSGLHRLPIHGWNGTWSANGEYYFYFTSRDIRVLPERRSVFGEVELGTSMQVTPGPMEFSGLAPTADGTQLFVAGAQRKGQLLHYDSKSNQFVPFLGAISASELEVSPDGQWIAYITYPEFNLWRSKLDGSDRLQLTFAPLIASEPHWSPDGKQILFTDVPSKIFVVPAEGGTPRQLMPGDHPNIIGAGTWLPDGNSIVFVRLMGCPTDDFTCYKEKGEAIYLLNLKTQEVSKLPGSDNMFASRVSRDGRYVTAFTTDEKKLMLYDFQTERWAELTQGKGGDAMVWSHDSRFVYLNIKHGPPSEVLRISIPDGKIERVLDLRDETKTLGVWDGWTGLLPDDSLLLTFDKSTSDIHRLDIQFR